MPALTLKEAAAELRISYRRLQDIVKRHPFYYPNGNRKLFTEENLSLIRSALLEEKLNSERPRKTTVVAEPSGAMALKKVLAFLAANKRQARPKRRNASRLRPRSRELPDE
ncbi:MULTISPECIES: hypothetical protein [unclassified Bradyrhizobium]